MRSTTQKLFAVVLFAFGSIVITASSSATTFTLDTTTLSGVSDVGTITTAQIGKNLEVTITMKPGYSFLTDDGHLMFDTKGGLVLTESSLGDFSIQPMSDKLQSASTIGGFTFSDIYKTDLDEEHHSGNGQPGKGHKPSGDGDGDNDHSGKKHHHHHGHPKKADDVASSLTFTISNANINQIVGFGVGFCVTDQCGKMRGFAETATIVSTVPEPGTLALFGTGLIGLAGLVRFRHSRRIRSSVG